MNADFLIQVLPKVPLMVRTAIFHALGLSPPSKYVDLQTEVVCALIRAYLQPSKPHTVTATQRMMATVPPIKGRIWVATYECPAPLPADEERRGVRATIKQAIDEMWNPRCPRAEYALADVVPVEAEWTGYRAGAGPRSPPPMGLSQRDTYAAMMKEVRSPTTILYFHGGAYFLLDPATHRPGCKTLAKLTGGRVYSVRYRLAPQHPFPAALTDALVSYLALLYPPEGAFHEPVAPEHIVFAGDSAGGNLALSLMTLLLHLHRTHGPAFTVDWRGKQVPLPLPAGVAVNSPWIDITHSSPSYATNTPFDFLPPPAALAAADATRPPCPAWPANPPRQTFYAADALLAHPLVTFFFNPSWAGAPPVFLCTGWELLADEDKWMARRLRDCGVPVVFEEYLGMPHCFALMFAGSKVGRRCMDSWAGFCKTVVEDPKGIRPRFVKVEPRSLTETAVAGTDVGADAKGGSKATEEKKIEVQQDDEEKGWSQDEIWERVCKAMRRGVVEEGAVARL